ncbi:MAG: hypothetical protein ABIH47_02830 [Candidatus Omnitrophota bacterium]
MHSRHFGAVKTLSDTVGIAAVAACGTAANAVKWGFEYTQADSIVGLENRGK